MIGAACEHDQHAQCHEVGCLCGCHVFAAVGAAPYWNVVEATP